MSNNNFEENSVNGTGINDDGVALGRCPTGRQGGPARYTATVRMKWNKEVNNVVMECYYRGRPVDERGVPIRGYRKRLFCEWKERGLFESTEQRICDQARAIRKNGWLTEVELETIRRRASKDCIEAGKNEEEVFNELGGSC